MKLCLVFPKPFEAANSVLSIIGHIWNLRIIAEWHWELILKRSQNPDGEYIKFEILTIRDGDIGFYYRLKDLQHDRQYVLIGSCGLLELSHDNLDQKQQEILQSEIPEYEGDIPVVEQKLLYTSYFITKAIKYDRGEVYDELINLGPKTKKQKTTHLNQSKIRTRIDKHLIISKNLSQVMSVLSSKLNTPTATILSNNFLMNSECVDKWEEIKNESFILADMESYDYLKYCDDNNINNVGVIRIVSDIIGEKRQDVDRCLLNVSSLRLIIIELITLCGEYSTKSNNLNVPELSKLCQSVVVNKISKVLKENKIMKPSKILKDRLTQYFTGINLPNAMNMIFN
jgi:hypothetical protein